MPNRMLRDWTDSEAVNELSDKGERLFVRLIQVADDYGRFSANPKIVKGKAIPLLDWNLKEINRLINSLHQAGLITLYGAKGKVFLEINNFNQRIRNQASKYPDPEVIARTNDGGSRTNDGGSRTNDGLDVDVDVVVFGDVDVDAIAGDDSGKINNLEAKKKAEEQRAKDEMFAEFWNAFAYKDGKQEARRTFMKIPHLSKIFHKILHGAKKEAARRPELEANGRTPKMAQGWLTSKRWEDYEEDPLFAANTSSVYDEDLIRRVVTDHFPEHLDDVDKFVLGAIDIPPQIKSRIQEESAQ